MYTQMLFALFWERLIWGTSPGWLSIFGSIMILGSALYVGTRKQKKAEPPAARTDEEVGFMERRGSIDLQEEEEQQRRTMA